MFFYEIKTYTTAGYAAIFVVDYLNGANLQSRSFYRDDRNILLYVF